MRSFENIRRVVAIVGCQRSGTTLTGQIVGSHPRAVLIDEFDGLYAWFRAWAAGRDPDDFAQPMLDRAAGKYRDGADRIGRDGERTLLSPRVDTLVLKAPNLTFDEEALSGFPVPVTVVYPVRDPRAVVASMARLDHIDFLGNQLRLIGERAHMLARHAEECARIADQAAPPWTRRAVLWRLKSGRAAAFEAAGLPVHAFRYEDLVSVSTATTHALMEACGLADTAPPAAHTVFQGLGPGNTDRTRPVDTVSLESWRSALPPSQQADVMAAAQPLAGQLGYE